MYPERYWGAITETWAAANGALKVETSDLAPEACA